MRSPDSLAQFLGHWSAAACATWSSALDPAIPPSRGPRGSERKLRVHRVIDERAAAFFALGIARATGEVPALLCTSGSAPAHYHPAVLEADRANHPLVVLSADRPDSVQHSDAAQTVDQIRLFGSAVRRFVDLSAPSDADGFMRVAQLVHSTVFRATHPLPGPVHLNLHAAKPLEPTDATVDASTFDGLDRFSAPKPAADPVRAAALADLVRSGRTAIVVGPLDEPLARRLRPSVERLATTLGAPIAAETASQMRVDTNAALMRSFSAWLTCDGFATHFSPECIVELGAPPVARGYAEWLGRVRATRIRLSAHQLADPFGRAHCWAGPPDLNVAALADACSGQPATPATPATLRGVTETLDRLATGTLADLAETEPFGEAQAVRAVLGALRRAPDTPNLMLGNSLPIRAVDRFGDALRPDVHVLHQRGANGIDGLVAGSVGSALATCKPTVLLLGDVSLVHDLAALRLARRLRSPLAVVCINNGGGRIFDELPIAHHVQELDDWTTPHDTDFRHVAGVAGIDHHLATTAPETSARTLEALERPAATLVEVRVPSDSHKRFSAALSARLTAALRTEFTS